jgi:hypothetical protein
MAALSAADRPSMLTCTTSRDRGLSDDAGQSLARSMTTCG